MQRRTLLKLGGLSLVGLLQLKLLAGCKNQSEAPLATSAGSPGAEAALRELAASLVGIEFVGPVCRGMFSDKDIATDLLEQLDGANSENLGEALDQRIARDHREGERIDIGGWQLARTECMLLALAAQTRSLGEPKRADMPELEFEPFAEIERWGPNETIQGEMFNPIGNGRGGFWIRVAEPVPGSTRLVLNGVELATHFEPGVVTASLEPDYMERIINQPGMYELLMVETARNVAQRVGHLTVRPMPPAATLDNGRKSEVFCEIERWGPDHVPQGQVFNEQSDGSAAFWVRIGCAPDGSQLVLDGKPLPTTVRSGIVTARVPHYGELSVGNHELRIHDPGSGETLTVGQLTIL